MKTGDRVKIGIFFLVRGTLLILINKVLVKCYCEVFFWEDVMYRFRHEARDLKGNTIIPQEALLSTSVSCCYPSLYLSFGLQCLF